MTIALSLVAIIIFATLVQFVTDVLKGLLPAKLLAYINPRIIAAAVGILLAVMFRLDIFAMLGFTTQLVLVAYIITGLIISAGAEAVHELLAKLRESRGQIDV